MKLFYDHLILVEDIFSAIDQLEMTADEKEKAKKMSDEYLHTHVLIYILDILPKAHHEEFLVRFHSTPFDMSHLVFIEEKTQRDIRMDLVVLGKKIKSELLSEIKKNQRNTK